MRTNHTNHRQEKILYGFSIFLVMLFGLVIVKYVLAPAGSTCATENYVCACDPNCQGTYELMGNSKTFCQSNPINCFNTIDSCADGSDESGWEYVEKMIITNINSTDFTGGNIVEVFGQYYCYPGDIITIAYSNNSNADSTIWRNVYSGQCPSFGYYNVYRNFTLDENGGMHAYRFIIAYPGASEMTCGQAYSSSDTDDIDFYVIPKPDLESPNILNIYPATGQNFEYSVGLEIPVIVNATDFTGVNEIYANITWPGGQNLSKIIFHSANQYNATIKNLANFTRYNITIIANDTLGNLGHNYSHFFITNNYGVNITSPILSNTYPYKNISLRFIINDNNTPYQEVYYSLNSQNNTYLFETFSIVNNISNSPASYLQNNLTNISQSFNTTEAMNVNSIRMRLKKSTSSTYLTSVQIREDNSGEPGTMLISYNLSSDLMSDTDFQWVNITFNDTITLQSNSYYWVYLNSSEDDTDYLLWEANNDTFANGVSYQNNSMDLLFYIYDRFKYSATLNALEGGNTLDVCERDAISIIKCSYTTFKADTIPPVSGIPTETSDPFELGNPYQFITININDVTSSVNSVRINANGTNYTTDYLGSNNYQYRWDIDHLGTYYYWFYFNDSVGNTNQTSAYNFSVDDTRAPDTSDLAYYPTISGQLDPNQTIYVNITVADYSEIMNVTLQYKIQDTSIWINKSMYNSSSTYMQNFTPDTEANWSFRIFVVDEHNNSNTTQTINVSVFYDKTWNSSPSEFSEIFIAQGEIIEAGNITINNTGDTNLDFTVAKYAGTPVVYINETSFIVPSQATKLVNISVQAPAQHPLPYSYTLVINCVTENCEKSLDYVDGLIAVGEGGTYLSFSEVIYDPSVTQGQRKILLNTTIKNIGNETALNTTLNWSLPPGWGTNDNLTTYFGNISPYSTTFQLEYYGIYTDVALDAPTGTQNLTIYLEYYTISNESRLRYITKSIEVAIYDTGQGGEETPGPGDDTPSRGPSGPVSPTISSGGPLFVPTYNLTLSFPRTIEILRGQNKTLRVNVTNNNDAIFNDLNVGVLGFPVSRFKITPLTIEKLEQNETAYFDIFFDIPTYMGYEIYTLNLIFNAVTTRTINSSRREFTQEEILALIVSETDLNSSLVCLVESEALIDEMIGKNLNTDSVQGLLSEAKAAFGNLDYTRVKLLCDQIRDIHRKALELNGRILALSKEIEIAESDGYDISAIIRLLNLTSDMFNRGEYDGAELQLEKTEESLVLQIQMEDAMLTRKFFRIFKKYWWAFLLSLTVGFVIAVQTYRKKSELRVKEKISKLEKEESTISELTKKLQHEHFVEHAVSKKVYEIRMEDYKKRRAEIKDEIISLKNLQIKLFKISDSVEGLEKQRNELTDLIKKMQYDYFVSHSIDKNTYARTREVYKKRMSEIEKNLETKKGGVEGKPENAISGLFNSITKSFKSLRGSKNGRIKPGGEH
ncbi:hypothetical protein JW930_02325 [Candidatus Woesearchaeota archaeon]|nr:hypothetical protein [Candidatus Woesearchaeota archaeon]